MKKIKDQNFRTKAFFGCYLRVSLLNYVIRKIMRIGRIHLTVDVNVPSRLRVSPRKKTYHPSFGQRTEPKSARREKHRRRAKRNIPDLESSLVCKDTFELVERPGRRRRKGRTDRGDQMYHMAN